MTFAAPAFLGLLAVIPVVIYLHMRRHRHLRVPTTDIWRKVLENAEPRPRVRPVKSSVALWLQVVTVALAALALAEPQFPGAPAKHHVLVLDAGALAGATMGAAGKTAYEVAWRDWLDSRPRGSGYVYSVWSVAHRTRPLALELTSIDAVRRSLENSSHADAPADWLSAANTLYPAYLEEAVVTVVSSSPSDAQAAFASLANVNEMEFTRLAAPMSNFGITTASLQRSEDGRSWDVDIVVAVQADVSDVPSSVTFDVRFTPRGSTTALPFDDATSGVTRANQARYAQSLELPGAGLLEVRVTTSDLLAVDDSVRFAVDPEPAPATVHVISPLGTASPAVRVLEAMGRFDVSVVDEPVREAPYPDLVVVEGTEDPYLEQYERPPHALIWLGTSPGVASLDGLPTAEAGTARWDRTHPVARGTAWWSTGSSRAIELAGHGPEVLVEGAVGPLVSAGAWPGGREVVSAFDPLDRTLVASDEFVSFMVDAVDWLVPPTPQVAACIVGEVCRLPWSLVSTGVSAESNGVAHWSLPAPTSVLPTRLDETWTPDTAGIWQLRNTLGEAISVAVNPPAAATAGLEVGADAASTAQEAGRTTLTMPWRGIASALLLLCVAVATAEAVLAGRGKEAFWRRSAMKTPGTTGRRTRFMFALQILALAAGITAVFAPPFPVPVLANWLVLVGGVDDEELPAGLSSWNENRLIRIELADQDGAVNPQRGIEHALASVDPAASLHVIAGLSASTRGQPLSVSQGLLDRNASLHTAVTTETRPATDVSAAGLFAPKTYYRGDVAELIASLHSSAETEAVVSVYLNDTVVLDVTIALEPGWSTLTVPIELEEEGNYQVALEVAAPGDEFTVNDRFETYMHVQGSPIVALFASDQERAAPLADALEIQGYEVEVKPPHTMSTHPGGFVGFESVIVMDVPAVDLARTQQEALETWVRESGGGLVLLGGESSFGPGGYLETPLDQLSPLSSKVSRDAPAVAMLFVLDRSGSMQQVVDGVTRLDIAKEATLAANDLLGEGSEIAVVVFDEEARTLLPFTSSSDVETIRSALVSLVPGGGTSLVPGLVAAAGVLETSDASSKHVVVMTDGLSQPGDIESAVQSLVDLDASVSAIAIGTGSDVERVRNIARIGGGTAHTTTDFRALPSILAQEAMLLSGDPVVRETVAPRRTASDAGLMSDMPSAFPPLHGFVETTAKVDATVLLDEEEGRPLLGAWRYGAGRVISFPSQAVGPWADEWAGSPEFPRWWGQWLRWAVQPGTREGLELAAEHIGDDLYVSVTATKESGRRLSVPSLLINASPDDDTTPGAEKRLSGLSVSLEETSPGVYSGVLPLGQGAWNITASAEDGGTAYTADTVAVLSYPSVFAGPRAPDPGLHGLVELTGGQHLTAATDWRPERQVAWMLTSAWRPWLVAAMVLWVVFLVLRYAPGWLSFRSVKSRRAGAKIATPNRTPAMPTR